MEDTNLNYKDVQLLLNCNTWEAKSIIYSHLRWEEKRDLESSSNVKVLHTVPLNKFTLKMNSFSETYNGKPTIQTIVNQIRNIGMSDKMKHEVLEDPKNLILGGLYGKWGSLKRILNKEQVKSLEDSILCRRSSFIKGGNKIPKALQKYVTAEG